MLCVCRVESVETYGVGRALYMLCVCRVESVETYGVYVLTRPV